MKFLIFFSIFISLQSYACGKEKAFNIGLGAIISKYSEYSVKKDIFTIKDHGQIWLVLRKQEVFKSKPKEYPRAVVQKETCAVERVLWSK